MQGAQSVSRTCCPATMETQTNSRQLQVPVGLQEQHHLLLLMFLQHLLVLQGRCTLGAAPPLTAQPSTQSSTLQ